MLRISARTAIWPRDSVRPRHSNSPRGFARRKTIGNNREHGQFSDRYTPLALHFAARKMADLTDGAIPNWSDTPPLGYTAWLSRISLLPYHRHSLPFRSTSGESELLASRCARLRHWQMQPIGYAAELA